MPQLYKILTFVLAFTGCISIVISGEVNPLMYITDRFLPDTTGFKRNATGARMGNRGFSVLTHGILYLTL
jgi:hypothetical protein